jgi:cell division protein FtsA
VIPIGGNSITQDIAMMLQISTTEAEDIKNKFGSAIASMSSTELEFDLPSQTGSLNRSISEHELSRYIEARASEILQYIARELSRADINGSLTYGIVLTGGGAQLNHMAKLSEEILKTKTRIGHPIHFGNSINLGKEPKFSASLGLLNWQDFIFTKGKIPNGEFRGIGGAITKFFEKLLSWFRGFF